MQEKRTNLSRRFGRVRATTVSGAKRSQLSSSEHGEFDSQTDRKTWENYRRKSHRRRKQRQTSSRRQPAKPTCRFSQQNVRLDKGKEGRQGRQGRRGGQGGQEGQEGKRGEGTEQRKIKGRNSQKQPSNRLLLRRCVRARAHSLPGPHASGYEY